MLNESQYNLMYKESVSEPDIFWSKQAKELLSWFKEWDTVTSGELMNGDIQWFEGGKLNVSYNCIDRHVENGDGERVAYYFEGNDGETIEITYSKLLENVSRLANLLKARGIKKGDRVCIYMPMIPEAVYAMLACTRIGAVHSVVFGGFSSNALLARIQDAKCSALITADIGKRGDKVTELKSKVDEILPEATSLHTVLVVKESENEVKETDVVLDYKKAVSTQDSVCTPEEMGSEDPLFILYTSGSTGKPKGVLHTTAGYLLYASMTHTYVFDYQKEDVYWCAADVGWITGHTYMVYGPLCNGATSVLYEGIPTYPDASRYWNVIDKYNVNIFYSTPTAIRMLRGLGDNFVTQTSRESLRILGSVGEPINPEAWHWYNDVVGNKKCHIVDTWWQTETGGIAIVPLPHAVSDLKPGAAMKPFFGIDPVIVNEKGEELEGKAEGILLLKGRWPGQMRGLYNDKERFLETYLKPFPGYYYPGDGAKKDANGDLWITGRIDDTLNIAGRLVGTAEVESSLVLHSSVSEAAVVGADDALTGSSVYAFVCLASGKEATDNLDDKLVALVKKEVGSFAKPKYIQYVSGLPKTRSGKIMRRILRKIIAHDEKNIGDTSTLANPEVVEEIIENRKI